MGNTKFDLITASKQKGYKIAMFSAIGIGVVLIVLGFILMATVTQTVMPNKLTISMSGLEGSKNIYTATISQNEYITVDTGTSNKALSVPIVFSFDEDGTKIFEPIESAHRDGLFLVKLKSTAEDNAKGTLTITCGSMQAIKITFTTKL